MHVRVALMFENNGEHCAAVVAWLEEHYPHLAASCWSQPGLAVSLQLPTERFDTQPQWAARFLAASSPIDLAYEILLQCFEQLGLTPCEIVAMHVTS